MLRRNLLDYGVGGVVLPSSGSSSSTCSSGCPGIACVRSLSRAGRQYVAAVRALQLTTEALELIHPVIVTGIAQLLSPDSADGSLVEVDGTVIGSALTGQAFTDGDGNLLPQYFQPRPAAAYDGAASGASTSDQLPRAGRADVVAAKARHKDGTAPTSVDSSGWD
jgi:K+-transporting ATPase ATPase C chain